MYINKIKKQTPEYIVINQFNYYDAQNIYCRHYMKKITGTPKRVIFESENGYRCVSITLKDGVAINVTGNIGDYSISLLSQTECPIDFYGVESHHPKFGKQFNFEYLCPSDSVEPAFYIELLKIPHTKKAHIKETLRRVEMFDKNALSLVKSSIDIHYSDKMAASVLKTLKQHIFWPLITKKILDSKAKVDRLELERTFMATNPESLDDLISNPYKMCISNIIDFKTASLFAGNNPGQGNDRQVAAITHTVTDICKKTGSSCAHLGVVVKAVEKLTGDKEVPEHKFINVFNNGVDDLIQTNRYEICEVSIADSIANLVTAKKSISLNASDIEKISSKHIADPTRCQSSAIGIIHNPVSIITGLPGTGKTYLVNSIVKIINDICSCNILMIGPTGASAKRLEEMTGETSKTIHSALGYNPGTNKYIYNEHNLLDVDWVFLDEGSMVDMFLGSKLLKAIPQSARLTIFGDVDQLQAINEGSILRDLFTQLPAVKMTSQKRFNSNGISKFCHALCEGKILKDIQSSDLKINIAPTENKLETWIHQSIEKIIAVTSKAGIDNVQILAPQYAGIAGIDLINEYCRKLLFPNQEPFEVMVGKKTYHYHKGHKIIFKRNMPDKGLFNGDIGIIKDFAKHESKEHLLTITCKGRNMQPSREIKLSRSDVRHMIPAYCISIHNSQGNEYNYALVIATKKASGLLSRNLLNTAISRGKRKVIVVSEPGALEMCAKRNESERLTRLQYQLTKKIKHNNPYKGKFAHAI
jgi:RecD/TraA family predicted helicase